MVVLLFFLFSLLYPASSLAFYDTFDDSSSLSNYDVFENEGIVEIVDGKLKLSPTNTGDDTYPYLKLKDINYLEPINVVEVKVRYSVVGDLGAGISIDDYYPDNGETANVGSNSLLWTWNWENPGIARYGYYDAGNHLYHDFPVQNKEYTIKIEKNSPSIYSIFFDGELVDYITSSKPIKSVWFGNPQVWNGSGEWPTIEIDDLIINNDTPPRYNSFPFYSQLDPLWASDEYDHASSWAEEGSREMEEWGCAVTSAAMILTKHEINSPNNNETTTPQLLNNWLKNEPDGYIRNGLTNWLAISRYTHLSEQAGYAPYSLEYERAGFDSELASEKLTGDPSIPLITRDNNSHFLSIYGEDTDNWLIADPLEIESTQIAKSDANYQNMGIYTPSHTDLSYMMFVTEPGVSVHLYDSAGNELAIESETESLEGGVEVQVIYYRQPTTGEYRLVIEGEGEIELYFYNQDGEVEQLVDELGEGEKKAWSVDYRKDDSDVVDTAELDITPPAVPTLLSPTDGSLVKPDGLILDWDDVSDESLPVTYNYRSSWLPSGNYGPVSTGTNSQINASASADRTYYWQVQACDGVGNCSEWSEPWKITIDGTAPTAPEIANPPQDSYQTTQPILNDWNDVYDLNGIDYYRIEYDYDDHHSFSNAPYRTTTASQRNHTPQLWEQGGVSYRVQAYDKAGNEGAWSEWRHYYYDPEAPTAPGEPTTDEYFTNKTIQDWEWTAASDEASEVVGYYQRIYDVLASDFLGDWYWLGNVLGNSTSLVDGEWQIRVKAEDAAGNQSNSAISEELTVDLTAPSIPEMLGFYDPELACGGYTNEKTVTVDWSDSTDNFDLWRYQYQIDYPLSFGDGRGVWTTYFTNSQYRGSLNEGEHIIKVRAEDLAGNYSDWSNTCSITYDSIAPLLSSKSEFLDSWYNTVQTSYFTYADTNLPSGYTDPSCEIAAEGAGTSCSITPNVCDLAGNCNTTLVSSNTLNLDLSKPNITLSEWGSRLSGTASDSLSGVERVEIRLTKPGESEQTVIALGTSDWTYLIEPAPIGNYTAKIVAYDKAGNASGEIVKEYQINPSEPATTSSGEVEPNQEDGGAVLGETVTTNKDGWTEPESKSPEPSTSPLASSTPTPIPDSSREPMILGESDSNQGNNGLYWWLLVLLVPGAYIYHKARR